MGSYLRDPVFADRVFGKVISDIGAVSGTTLPAMVVSCRSSGCALTNAVEVGNRRARLDVIARLVGHFHGNSAIVNRT